MDALVALVLGAIAGLLIGWGTAYDGMLERCEAELPRAEHCILIAVPEKGELDK